MRAIRIHTPGDASHLSLDDMDVPTPKPGEARIRVAFAGLNFIDVYHRSGTYKLPLPAVIGSEGAGVVDAVGDGVTEVRPGQRVAWATSVGAYAEFAVVPAWKLAPIPEGVTDEIAAAVMLQGMTAHYLARSTYPLKEGDTALVHAAAGGVGQLLVQIAAKLGASVIATVGSEEKAEIARGLGARHVILYREQDFVAQTKRVTQERGVDVVYDSVGRDTFLKGFDVLRPRGLMCLYGASSGPVEPFDPQLLNAKGSVFVTRPTLGHYIATREELMGRASELFEWIQRGELKVTVDRVFGLAEAPEAHGYMEARRTKGKVLLEVAARNT
ncbi:quinone oxidoreductase family protein [Deinococcus yavapaiensis]|uniref:NADPH:quinone reductase-like Zn-dependent oxidoreductase n=1 Tax=Deinococcus yavapaiensis KR-236 TaxID=694435 RepID=A0A318S1M0_9DEIO|nr:quinone oxidoreductase [Deinococcus yavapaiensis]PYE51126.1 NADPH:quinone reductase-like Zn-dependent oxidoreductase [Deinococcus yavapaiensis KR-236]